MIHPPRHRSTSTILNHIMVRCAAAIQGKHMVNCYSSRGRSEKLAVEADTLEDGGRGSEKAERKMTRIWLVNRSRR